MQVSLDDSELRNIRRSNVIFYRTYVKVFMEKSKNDSYREGKQVLIARTGKLTCPVSMLKRYLAKENIRADEDNFIFRSLNYFRSCRRQYKLKGTMKPLSYSRTREIVLEGLKKIGLNPIQAGLFWNHIGWEGAHCAPPPSVSLLFVVQLPLNLAC